MIKIFQTASRLLEKGEPFVIGTIVRTKGSTPQKPGAKMLIRQDDRAIGTLGGGCVEGDIWYVGKQLLAKKAGPVFRKYTLNEELAARDGLVCGGTMHVFIEPVFGPGAPAMFVDEILQALVNGPSVAVTTLVADPTTASRIGAKRLVHEDGSIQGSLGDAEFDREVGEVGRSVAAFGEKKCVQLANGAEVFIEGFTTQPTLILLGGGHVNKAVSSLAATLGFRIYIIDDRPEFASKARFPEAEDVVIAEYDEGLAHVPTNANTFIIVATRGHRFDDVALAAALGTPARFIGLLGSKRKTLTIYKHLLSDGVALERIREVHAPLGLDIGAITPEEIAVSIMAEVILVRRGGEGTPLKMSGSYLEKVLRKT